MGNRNIQEDLQFATDKRDMVLLEVPRGARSMVYVVILCFISLFVWAYVAEIDEVRKGEGVAVPLHQVQQIQSLEGGILKELAVKEGERVEPGQTLAVLDDTQVDASKDEVEVELRSLRVKVERLNAEIGRTELDTEELTRQYSDLANNEITIYQSNEAKLQDEIDVLESRQSQKTEEINELEGLVRNGKAELSIANDELAVVQRLRSSGAVSDFEVLNAREKATGLTKEVESAESRLNRAKEELNELVKTVEQAQSQFMNDRLNERDEVLLRINKLLAQQQGLQDREARTLVVAPLEGIVKKINLNTIGGVLQPGMTLMEIVPFGDQLLVETKIRPRDIGFVHPGMRAKVKFSAYDFATYGGMDGTVQQVSADAITDDKGETYFLVKIETEKAYVGTDENQLPVIPGMRGEVDIAVAKRTVLSYFFNPILKGVQ